MSSVQTNLRTPARNFTAILDGKPIGLYYLQNGNYSVSITNYGGRIVNLLVPDKEGNTVDIALGYDSFEGFYHSPEAFLAPSSAAMPTGLPMEN